MARPAGAHPLGREARTSVTTIVFDVIGTVVDEGSIAEDASATLNSITEGRGGGRRFRRASPSSDAGVLGVQARVCRNTMWSRARRTSVLPRSDGGRPTFDRAPRRKVLRTALEARRNSAAPTADARGAASAPAAVTPFPSMRQ